jgi:hypothetical protein
MGIIPHINQVRWWDKDDMNPRDRPYIGSLKNILEKFYEEPLDRFFILCGEGG